LARKKRGGPKGWIGEQAGEWWRGFAGHRLLGWPDLWRDAGESIVRCLVDMDEIYPTRVFTFDDYFSFGPFNSEINTQIKVLWILWSN